MLQIGGELEEAAEIAGAGFFKRFIRIVFPLSKGGFISGFMPVSYTHLDVYKRQE